MLYEFLPQNFEVLRQLKFSLFGGKKLEQDYIRSAFYSIRVPLFIRPPGSIQHYTLCQHIAPGK
jgi:hypothetical protein